MKIAFVIYSLAQGGAERTVVRLATYLSKEHDISIIVFSEENDYNYKGKLININVPSKSGYLKVLNVFYRTYKLRKLFKKEKYDKVISFMESANYPSVLTRYDVNISIRLDPNEYWNRSISKINELLYSFNNVKSIIAPSKIISQELNKRLPNKDIKLINNPVDFSEIKNDILSLENDDFIISIGRLDKIKRFDILISAFLETKLYKDTQTKLLILGDGSEKKHLEKIIKLNKAEDRVILKGSVSNIYKYLLRAKFFVFFSKSESFGNVIIESLSCGKPIVSSNCGIVNEVIKDDYNGYKVESRKELIEKIDLLSMKYKAFNKNSIESVKSFNIKEICKKWVDL